MANKPKRRAFTLRPVKVTPALALSTLAAAVAVKTGISGVAVSTYRAMSIKASWATSLLMEGPVAVGLAHSDYTVTEIKEAIEAAAAINQGNKIAQEQANRLVRVVGYITPDDDNLNDGKPITTKLNWLMTIGSEVVMFVYNDSGAVLTTGAIQQLNGTLWVKDSA